MTNKVLAALMILIAMLLAANLYVQITGPVTDARADIVQGKNIFSTHTPDGLTIHIWGYSQEGSLNDSTVTAFYYGSIGTDGKYNKH